MASELNTIEQKRVDYLRNSLVLKSPDVETDPAFKFSDEDLLFILDTATSTHNPKYNASDLPDSEFGFVVLLARKEVYWRLANATAPFYPLSAEGAELKKNVRFDHYFALLKYVDESYSKMLKAREEADSQMGNGVFTLEQYTTARSHTRRNQLGVVYNLEVKIMAEGENSLDITWTVPLTGNFYDYLVYVDKTPVFDPYEDVSIRLDAEPKFQTYDRLRTKYRAKGLDAGQKYYVCVVARMRNGRNAFDQVEANTRELVTP